MTSKPNFFDTHPKKISLIPTQKIVISSQKDTTAYGDHVMFERLFEKALPWGELTSKRFGGKLRKAGTIGIIRQLSFVFIHYPKNNYKKFGLPRFENEQNWKKFDREKTTSSRQ